MKNQRIRLSLFFFSVIVFCLCFIACSSPASAKQIQIIVNGEPMHLAADSQPFLSHNRTMVPLRAISQFFDCDVEWIAQGEGSTGNVYITPKNQTGEYEMSYLFLIDYHEYYYRGPNGDGFPPEYAPKTFPLDVPPTIVNSRTFVPLRVIGEIFGEVQWDGKSQTVIITTKGNQNKVEKLQSTQTGSTTLSKELTDKIYTFMPNEKIVFSAVDAHFTPQLFLDIMTVQPVNKKYTNEKFGFEFAYPQEWTAAPEPDAHDGRIFYVNPAITVRVWGSYLITDELLKEVNELATKNFHSFPYYTREEESTDTLAYEYAIVDKKTDPKVRMIIRVEISKNKPYVDENGFSRDERLNYIKLLCENAFWGFAKVHG